MYIIFDMGGTNTRIARSYDGVSFRDSVKFATHPNFEVGSALLADKIRELADGEPLQAVAGGIAGTFDRNRATLLRSPNLPEWCGHPLKDTLESLCDVPVYLENDTVMGGLGEMHTGAGIVDGIGVYLTVSTGVGGCRFIDGIPDRNVHGFEPGWQIIDAGGALCPGCSEHGYLEDYIGGRAIERRQGVKPYTITDPAFWKEQAKLLALGLVNISVLWSPDRIVIGGAMMNTIGIPIPETRAYLAEYLTAFPNPPEVVHAKWSDEMGFYGALAYIRLKEADRSG